MNCVLPGHYPINLFSNIDTINGPAGILSSSKMWCGTFTTSWLTPFKLLQLTVMSDTLIRWIEQRYNLRFDNYHPSTSYRRKLSGWILTKYEEQSTNAWITCSWRLMVLAHGLPSHRYNAWASYLGTAIFVGPGSARAHRSHSNDTTTSALAADHKPTFFLVHARHSWWLLSLWRERHLVSTRLFNTINDGAERIIISTILLLTLRTKHYIRQMQRCAWNVREIRYRSTVEMESDLYIWPRSKKSPYLWKVPQFSLQNY